MANSAILERAVDAVAALDWGCFKGEGPKRWMAAGTSVNTTCFGG